MKQKILDLINSKPKHYNLLIKKDAAMMQWVEENAKTCSDNVAARVYSAVNSESDVCEYGKTKKFTRFSTGFSGCGPASTCECTRKNIAKHVSETKLNLDEGAKTAINDKRSATMVEKHGVAYNSQRSDIKHIWAKSKLNPIAEKALSDYSWLEKEYITNQRTAVDIAEELGVYYSTVIDHCKRHGFAIRRRSSYSMVEREIASYIESFGIVTEAGNWDILGNLELDVYIPSKSLAIEVNGLYWHSSPDIEVDRLKRSRHLEKTKLAADKGVDLIHITDWEWINKKEIVKAIIQSKLGLNKKIHARKCKVVQLNSNAAKNFFNMNHIQGHCAATAYIGLEYNGEIVSAISMGKNRFDKKENSDSYELIRLASKFGITVVGGVSKLIAAFKSTHCGSIISYCDRSKSSGNGYKSAGFDLIGETDSGYFWTDGTEIISRYRAQKSKISKLVPTADLSKSESEIMFSAGYRRYWDCGNYVFKI
jgi:hypothetical protein